jgi:hypothetical protein
LRSKGVPIKIVCDVVRKGKGLMVGSTGRSFADLRGKELATCAARQPDIWVRQKLIDEGLNPDRDVNLVNLDYLSDGHGGVCAGPRSGDASGLPCPSSPHSRRKEVRRVLAP